MYCSTNIAFTQESVDNQQSEQLAAENDTATHADDANDQVPFEAGKPTPSETIQVIAKPPSDNILKTEPNTIQAVPENKSPQNNYTTGVLLQGLNKITARTSKLEVKSDQPIKFGNLSIILHACWKSPPEEAPESKALLEMWEEIPGENRKKIFSGWMFASSPLISAPEHPVYDITVLECVENKVERKNQEN